MDGDALTRMGLTLAMLLGIPGVLLLVLRRFGLRLPGQPDLGGRLAIVSRLAIDAKHSLILVRRDGREQLILLSPTGPTVVEAEVKLSPADRAAHKRRAEDEAERAAASRAALVAARARAEQRFVAVVTAVRALADRLLAQGRPSFRRLVDKGLARRPAVSPPPLAAKRRRQARPVRKRRA